MRPTIKVVVLDLTGTFIINGDAKQSWDWFCQRGILVLIWRGSERIWGSSLPGLAKPAIGQLNDKVCLRSLAHRFQISAEEILWVHNDPEAGHKVLSELSLGIHTLDISGNNLLDRDEIANEVMRLQGDGH